ncbi:GNAT family N-acetyltransferase [Actinoplanes sp. NPDC026670]|uniref:GNAT family N-acetyltransferase n=1 Tax=Actinoplanes sp. NPDC026670 TaxID=3154700 RepID=UPI0033F459F7
MGGVRQFRWGDYERVVVVWEASGIGVLSRPELEAKLLRDPELFLVAEPESGEDVSGVVLGTYDGRRGWIFRLGVHPGYRRQGVATQLVAELESRLQALGCPRINLLVMPDNDAGLRFWASLGYLSYPDVLCSKPMPDPSNLLS